MQPDGRARKGGGAVLTDPIVGTARSTAATASARGSPAAAWPASTRPPTSGSTAPCAVKVMHPGLGDDEEFAARFVREARSAARLDHPNVVAVFDQGDDDGTVFLVMEHVAGHTLRDVIRKESPMAPSRALALLEPVLSALAHAHRAGLIHRDVKPENVLIADDGRVKVADFGLAKAVSADTQHTATGGVLIGTVSYLAPELVVDGRSRRARRRLRRRACCSTSCSPAPSRTRASPRSRSPTSTCTRTSRRRRRSCPACRRTSTRWSPGPPRATSTSGPPTPACCCTRCTGSPRRCATASARTTS